MAGVGSGTLVELEWKACLDLFFVQWSVLDWLDSLLFDSPSGLLPGSSMADLYVQ
jgi:hypothetical protein